jgi:adenylosuccinate lyase
MDTLKATEAGKLISDSEFSELFDINYYLRNIDSVYKKCGLK